MFRNETLDFWEIQSQLLSILKIETNAKQMQKLKQEWMAEESHNPINESELVIMMWIIKLTKL